MANGENTRLISLALHFVKRKIHEGQVDPKVKGADPYVSIKRVDLIIDECLNNLKEDAKDE